MSGTAGVIGLGIMGGAMARHLVKAGFTVHGFDPSADAVEAARGDGVETLASAAAVAEKRGSLSAPCQIRWRSAPWQRKSPRHQRRAA